MIDIEHISAKQIQSIPWTCFISNSERSVVSVAGADEGKVETVENKPLSKC